MVSETATWVGTLLYEWDYDSHHSFSMDSYSR